MPVGEVVGSTGRASSTRAQPRAGPQGAANEGGSAESLAPDLIAYPDSTSTAWEGTPSGYNGGHATPLPMCVRSQS